MSTRLDGIIDYFSIDLLAKTLFQPFRQDATGRVDGPLDMKLRAFADNMISRVLGALIRTVILLFGLIAIAVSVILFIIVLLLWILLPIAPVIGFILMSVGVTF
jgi:fatty acid desaturase